MENPQQTVIIIGAGPAGLTAAYTLLKENKGFRPVVLEATDRIGGISQTVVHNGNRIDIGGHRFFSKNGEVVALWNGLMPTQGLPAKDDIILNNKKPFVPRGPDPEREERVMLLRNRVSRIFYLRKFFDYPISVKPATFINMGVWRTVKAGLGYLASAVRKREERSLEDFYINRFGKPLYRMFFEDYTEKLWGIHPSRIAPDWGAQRVRGLSLFKAVASVFMKPFRKNGGRVETSLIDSFAYPKKGPGQYWEVMADEIRRMGGEIIMSAEVAGISLDGQCVTSVTYRENGINKTLSGDAVFSSMPVKDLVHALGSPVPGRVREIAGKLPYRDFITVGLLVRKLKLKNTTKIKTVAGIVPDCWIYIQEREVKLGRLQIFNNWSPYMVKDLENTVWVGLEYFCSEGDWMWTMPEKEFIRFAVDELVKIGIIGLEDVMDSVAIKIKKAYPAYFGSYADFGEIRSYLDTLPNLYCIGRNGQHRYNNMDHSMLTAIAAVRSLNGDTPKSRVWEVNTEEDYHEEK